MHLQRRIQMKCSVCQSQLEGGNAQKRNRLVQVWLPPLAGLLGGRGPAFAEGSPWFIALMLVFGKRIFSGDAVTRCALRLARFTPVLKFGSGTELTWAECIRLR
jgi:hypothetical protein